MKKIVAVKVDEEVLEAIDEMVKREARKIRLSNHIPVEITRSDVLRQLIREGLDALQQEAGR